MLFGCVSYTQEKKTPEHTFKFIFIYSRNTLTNSQFNQCRTNLSRRSWKEMVKVESGRYSGKVFVKCPECFSGMNYKSSSELLSSREALQIVFECSNPDCLHLFPVVVRNS